MKIKEKFAEIFAEHDKSVMEAYIKKEKNRLKKELLQLENERSMMRNHLHRIETLIERDDAPREATNQKQSDQSSMENAHETWPHLEKKLREWEIHFAKIWAKKAEDHSDAEREYAAKELPMLKEEKRLVQSRLMSIEGIIAKTNILIDDLNEDICRKLSKGRKLSDVGTIILKNFGHKLKEPHSKGRKTIRRFLEQQLNISKEESSQLFSLIEETGILFYRAGLPENFRDVPLMYYPYEEELSAGVDMGVLYQLNGWWEIRE